MTKQRTVERRFKGSPTIEGAGVHLKRIFGFGDEEMFDPFLMLDHFGSSRPKDYEAGFPWHPHRGIETITYVLEGEVEHMDSLGNKGTIGPGDIQWMTAGSGIIHQEMPKGDDADRMSGFQLWANLPRGNKMMPPKYRELKAVDIPTVTVGNSVKIKIIAGALEDIEGPMDDIVIQPEYLDVDIPAKQTFRHRMPMGRTAFAYVFRGQAYFGPPDNSSMIAQGELALFSDGDEVHVAAADDNARFILVSGAPLGDPIAWRGPIVMNTEQELLLAFEEYRNGTFVKKGQSSGSN